MEMDEVCFRSRSIWRQWAEGKYVWVPDQSVVAKATPAAPAVPAGAPPKAAKGKGRTSAQAKAKGSVPAQGKGKQGKGKARAKATGKAPAKAGTKAPAKAKAAAKTGKAPAKAKAGARPGGPGHWAWRTGEWVKEVKRFVCIAERVGRKYLLLRLPDAIVEGTGTGGGGAISNQE